MNFEWDDEKEKAHRVKHGLDFRTAAMVLADPYRKEKYDAKHSVTEERYITIGKIGDTVAILTVVYTERGDAIRIISARLATKHEKEAYYREDEY